KAIEQVCDEQKDLRTEKPALPEVTENEVTEFIGKLVTAVRRLSLPFPEFALRFESVAQSICELDMKNLREDEQRLTALEEQRIALIKVASSDTLLLEIKREVDSELNPFRSRMTAEQLTMLEHQMWRRKLLERLEVPRLSLFYLI